MICKCQYFKYVNGELVCSVCGKPAHSDDQIEDKAIRTVNKKKRR